MKTFKLLYMNIIFENSSAIYLNKFVKGIKNRNKPTVKLAGTGIVSLVFGLVSSTQWAVDPSGKSASTAEINVTAKTML